MEPKNTIEFRLLDLDKTQRGRHLIRASAIFELAYVAKSAPEIKTPSDIKVDGLGEGAFFIVLPMTQIGVKSRNGWRYTEDAVMMLMQQVNDKRPEGDWGHTPSYEMDTKYGPPAIRWLVAELDAKTGVVWGKALPLTEEARSYYTLAEATNARVGTSLVAWAEVDGEDVKALDLMVVDIAPPSRVGVPMTASPVKIMYQMDDGNNAIREEQGDEDVGSSAEATKNAGNSESGDSADTKSDSGEDARSGDGEDDSSDADESGIESDGDEDAEEVLDSEDEESEDKEEEMDPEKDKKDDKEKGGDNKGADSKNTSMLGSDVLRQRDQLQLNVTEMTPKADAFRQVAELFGTPVVAGKETDVVDVAKSFMTEFEALIDECINGVTVVECKVPSVRPVIQELARGRKPRTVTEVKTVVGEVMKAEHIQRMIAQAAVADQGGAHKRVGKNGQQEHSYFELPTT